MSTSQEGADWVKQRLISSQLVLSVYDDFKLQVLKNTDGSVNADRYKLENTYHQPSIRDDAIIDGYEFPSVSGFEQNKLSESFELVSVYVYADSVCINGTQVHNLRRTVIDSCVIRANKYTKEDTLVVALDGDLIVLLRFLPTELGNYDAFVVDYTKMKCLTVHSNLLGTRLVTSELDKKSTIYEITYSSFGTPIINPKKTLVSQGHIFGTCFAPLSDDQEMFVRVLNTYDKILKIQCYTKLQNCGTGNLDYNEIIMRNTFEIPIFTVPLNNSKSVLFIQPTGCTVKGSCFLLTGTGNDQALLKYPARRKIDGYHVPLKPIDFFDNNPTDSSTYIHDQVLISTNPSPALYVIDIYTEKVGAIHITMKKLFSLSTPFSIFSFEKIKDRLFKMIYSNSTGVCESRIVEIENKALSKNPDPSYFTMKYIKKILSRPGMVPVFDFCLTANPCKKTSNECSNNELWFSARPGDANVLAKPQSGYVARKKKFDFSLFDPEDMKSFEIDCRKFVLLSRRNCSCFIELKHYMNTDDIIFENPNSYEFHTLEETFLNQKTLSVEIFHDGEYIRITSNYIVRGNLLSNIIHDVFHLPEMALMADAMDNKFAILCSSIINVFKFENGTFTDIFQIKLDDNQDISFLKFVRFDSQLLLIYNTNVSLRVYNVSIATNDIKYHDSELESFSMPFDIALFRENIFIISTLNGEYFIAELESLDDGLSYKLKFGNRLKLSDCPLKIMKINMDLFLVGNRLWKFEKNLNLKPVIFDEFNARSLFSACTLPGDSKNLTEFLTYRNDGFSIFKLSSYESVKFQTISMPQTIVKIINCSQLGVLALVPVENENDLKILFFDVHSKKLLTTDFVGENITKMEFVTCVCEWNLVSKNKSAVSLAVSCRTDAASVVKIFSVTRTSDSITLKLLHNWAEPGIITCMQPFSNLIFYNVSETLFVREYDPDLKQLKQAYVISQYESPIKKFIADEKSYAVVTATNSYSLHLVSASPTTKTIDHGDFRQYVGDFGYFSSCLALGDPENGVVKIREQSRETFIKVGYVPRITGGTLKAPWIKTLQGFISVGLGGQTDVYYLTEQRNRTERHISRGLLEEAVVDYDSSHSYSFSKEENFCQYSILL
ncbi:hypothetical protein DAMA08_039070 [Martiniozyma asiatica (nom. inval.)]|nr:hypothetical protein DAMA08_039070 [Martiniozyma asiatica]